VLEDLFDARDAGHSVTHDYELPHGEVKGASNMPCRSSARLRGLLTKSVNHEVHTEPSTNNTVASRAGPLTNQLDLKPLMPAQAAGSAAIRTLMSRPRPATDSLVDLPFRAIVAKPH